MLTRPVLTNSLQSNGATPQVTGEGSLLLASKCFPTEGISGAKGHGTTDVTCKPGSDIAFDKVLPSSAINKNFITNFDTLRTMGDELVGKIVAQVFPDDGDNKA